MSPLELVLLAGAGVAVGVLSALLGVGGGVLMVPLLVVMGRGQHLAEGTSLLVIIPTAAAGVWAHRRRGYVHVRFALLLGLGGIVGAWAGARLALSIDAEALRRSFAIFMLIVGAKLLKEAFGPDETAST